jgi:hypothetical protein
MTTVTRTFDGGTPGNGTVSGENDVEVVQVGSQIFETGIHGVGVRAGSAANTSDTRFRVDLGVTGNHHGSVYLKNNTAHGSGSASVIFFRVASSGNAFVVEFRARPSNALSIRVSGLEVRAGNLNEIPVGAWFRLDWYIETGTLFEWKVFYDPEADGSSPDISGSLVPAGQIPSRVILGAESSSSIPKDWSFDTVRATDTDGWFGPYAPSTSSDNVTVWNGTTEVPASVSLWDGANEIPISAVEISA